MTERQQLARWQFEDGFRKAMEETDGRFEVLFLPRENFTGGDLYAQHGIRPPMLDIVSGNMDAAFCIDMIVDQAAGMTEEQFVSYVLYWIVRLRIRIAQEVELELMENTTVANEQMLEEMVESMMVANGYPRWWEGQLV